MCASVLKISILLLEHETVDNINSSKFSPNVFTSANNYITEYI